MAQIASTQVKRVLKTRHLSMIALGGSIGTGLFVASGSAIATAGPGGAIAAYVGIGLMVFFLDDQSWRDGDLCASFGVLFQNMPVALWILHLALRWGGNYWLNWSITLAVDVSTTAIVMHFGCQICQDG